MKTQSIKSLAQKESLSSSFKISIIFFILSFTLLTALWANIKIQIINERILIDEELIVDSIKIGDLSFLKRYLSTFSKNNAIQRINIYNHSSNDLLIDISTKNKKLLTDINFTKKIILTDDNHNSWSMIYYIKFNILDIYQPLLFAIVLGVAVYFFLKHQLLRLTVFFTNPLSNLHQDLILYKENPNEKRFYPTLYQKNMTFSELNIVVEELDNLMNIERMHLEERKKSEILKAEINLSRQVAHDIRSPLSALNAVVESFDGKPRNLLKKSIHRIEGIVNDLLKTPEGINANKDRNEITNIPLLIQSVVAEKRYEYINNDNFNIEENYSDVLSFSMINPITFKRCISNLINNSIDSLTNKGFIKIFTNIDANMFTITLEDNGHGIPKDILPAVFDQGFSHGKVNGSGLGLAHAKQTIESWNGKISIDSIQSLGTKVKIFLPLSSCPNWFCDNIIFNSGTIFYIIDNDLSIHESWIHRFNSQFPNLRIFTFSNFDSFIESYQTHNPHIILCDYDFGPNALNGIENIKKYNLIDNTILVTGMFEDLSVVSNCIDLGIKLLPKPLIHRIPIKMSNNT